MTQPNEAPSSKKAPMRFLGVATVIFVSALFLLLYTYALQSVSNESIISNAVSENCSRTDAMHKGVSGFLKEEDFPRSMAWTICPPTVTRAFRRSSTKFAP